MYIDSYLFLFFFFNDTATTEIYTLSLHDALPISRASSRLRPNPARGRDGLLACDVQPLPALPVLQVPVACLRPCILRSEEHTSELQSQSNLVCRLLLEKKKINALRH